MTLFLAGAGQTVEKLEGGAVGVPGQGKPLLPLQLTMSVDPSYRGVPYNGPRSAAAEILYAGSLAQIANGVVQMNVQLPDLDIDSVRDAKLTVQVGDDPASASTAAIFVWNGGR